MNIKKNWYIVAIVFGVVALFGLIGSCCMWSTEETITVTSLRWETSVYISKLRPTHYNRKTSVDMDAYNVTSWREYDAVIEDYKTYYSYTVDEWHTVDIKTLCGTRDEEIVYADVHLGHNQRATNSVDFTVGYKKSDGKLDSESVNENIWRELPDVGKQAIVIMRFYGISEVQK